MKSVLLLLSVTILVPSFAKAVTNRKLDLGFKHSKDPIVLVETKRAPTSMRAKPALSSSTTDSEAPHSLVIGFDYAASLATDTPLASVREKLGLGQMISHAESTDGVIDGFKWETEKEILIAYFLNGKLSQKNYRTIRARGVY